MKPPPKDEATEAANRAEAARDLPPPKYRHGEVVFVRARIQCRTCDERIAAINDDGTVGDRVPNLAQHDGEWVLETAGAAGNTNARSRLFRMHEEFIVSAGEARAIITGRRA